MTDTQSVPFPSLPLCVLPPQFKPGDISGPADLAQLLDLQWKKDAAAKQPAAVAGDGAAVDEPPVATATAAAGVASAAQWWRFPYSMSEAFNKVCSG